VQRVTVPADHDRSVVCRSHSPTWVGSRFPVAGFRAAVMEFEGAARTEP
jgi:hypothetical protein